MPFSTSVSTPRPARTPREIAARQRLGGWPGRPASAPRPRLAEGAIPLALAEPPPGDADALRHARDWQAHVDAGRIGAPAPVGVPAPGTELRFASLAAIFGRPACVGDRR